MQNACVTNEWKHTVLQYSLCCFRTKRIKLYNTIFDSFLGLYTISLTEILDIFKWNDTYILAKSFS